MVEDEAQVVARVVRGGVAESVHRGHLVVLAPDGSVRVRRGDPDGTFFARSSLKLVQAVAMLRSGLDLDGELLALACASHSGEPDHLSGVRRILDGAGLDEADLQNTPALPLDADAATAWVIAGNKPTRLTQNCSGKHAAMLATCVAAGWDRAAYLDPAHPLQRAIRATVAELTGDGDPAHVTIDGCGAPLFSCTPAGLARAFARIATAPAGTPEHRVAAAVRAFPWWLGGTGRFPTTLIVAAPGLVAKDGAEAVFAAALPDGGALAVKIADGSPRPLPPVVTALLGTLGVTGLGDIGEVPVLGHGEPVGEVEAVL
ncbi:asparaginase [Pseudonocardia sp. DSM 110487]|uniref:asparaginase n=1 Tax=Pseudonocardia sp. DSM 110487 TaxID=2865833 RepID=UPI001C69EC63|nr:asparaginase [Pseudonocardia sp. DSM 110487]QYN36442.1 asparaginase [Pseudonocardia sp. DSM 110487]